MISTLIRIFAIHMIRNISLSQKKPANHANNIQAIRMIRKTQKNISTEKYSLRITTESYDLRSSGYYLISEPVCLNYFLNIFELNLLPNRLSSYTNLAYKHPPFPLHTHSK